MLVVSLLLHAALLFLASMLWQGLAGGGPRVGGGGERPLLVAFYDPGPPGEPGPELGPELPPPEPDEPTPPEPEPPVLPAPAPEPSPAAEAASGGGGGTPPPGEDAIGSPAMGEVPGSPEEGTNRFQPPRLLTGALPLDPEEIENLAVPEEIPVRIRVGPDGRVLRIEPVDAGLPPVVREAIERSARAMRFLPARRGETAVEAWFSMTFIYDPGS
jgi:protein TonB